MDLQERASVSPVLQSRSFAEVSRTEGLGEASWRRSFMLSCSGSSLGVGLTVLPQLVCGDSALALNESNCVSGEELAVEFNN